MQSITFKKVKISLLLLSISISLFSQQEWSFGKKYKTYVVQASAPLAVKMESLSLQSLSFVAKVGGVAFKAVASPDAGLPISNIRVNYIPSQKDGQRLRIINGKDTVYAALPDWQLVPIVKYVNSGYNSCVSLFGPKTDDEYYDIVYNAGLQNSLLGLRILQADMMLMDAINLWDLPVADTKSVPVLGYDEIRPDSTTSKNVANQIDSMIKSFDDIQSWVLTDDSVNMTFSIQNKNIVFSGEPYYYFWGTHQTTFRKKMEKAYRKLKEAKESNTALACEDLNSFFNLVVARDSLMMLSYLGEESKPIMSMCTTELKRKFDFLTQMNPPVYNAILNTARFASFFRYIQVKNNVNWKSFVVTINTVQVRPPVRTPTVLPKYR